MHRAAEPGASRRWAYGLAGAAGLLAAGCGRERSSPSLEIISARRDAASDAREGSGHSGDFVAQQLALRARFLGPRMVPLGEPLRGVLAQGAEARVPVEVRTGHCYRFVTAGGVDVEDLDVSLVSPSGLTVEQEEGREPFAVLGRQPLCPPLTGDYTLVVRMARGNGQWGVLRVGTP